VDLDGLGIELQAVLVDKELLNIFTLITLKLNHLSHLSVDDNGAIASELLLDDLEDFLLIESLGKTLDSSQRLTPIALLNTNMNIVLRLFDVTYVFIDFGEGVEAFEVFDIGHKRFSGDGLELGSVSLIWLKKVDGSTECIICGGG